jgi:two-component system chemotaxis response regulator CheB
MAHPSIIRPTPNWPYRCVAIGASGGEGLDDIIALLSALPRPFSGVVLVVLHRPVDRISRLRGVLAEATGRTVRVAQQDEKLEADTVYIGEPDEHLELIGGRRAGLVQDVRREHRNRTIDVLFNSLATYAGRAAVGVVLSGSLDDGSRGLEAIHDAHGITMVLTPQRGGPPGMPENAVDYDGPINVIGSPTLIASEIAKLFAD